MQPNQKYSITSISQNLHFSCNNRHQVFFHEGMMYTVWIQWRREKKERKKIFKLMNTCFIHCYNTLEATFRVFKTQEHASIGYDDEQGDPKQYLVPQYWKLC